MQGSHKLTLMTASMKARLPLIYMKTAITHHWDCEILEILQDILKLVSTQLCCHKTAALPVGITFPANLITIQIKVTLSQCCKTVL